MRRISVLVPALLFTALVNAQAPVAAFSADTTVICAGFGIGFTDESTNGPTQWSWTFPGGTPATSNLQNPSVIYNTPGMYNVTLIAINGFGSDTLTQVNYITANDLPTTSAAGPDQTICITQTTCTLAANTPVIGTGTWYIINGTGTFANVNSPTTTVTGMSVGVNTYQWTIANDPCPTSIDQVVITVDDIPTAADAGPDQSICSDSSGTLNGNVPSVGAGLWTLVSGTGTPLNPNGANTPVTGLSPGANVFAWTISNGVCAPSSDTVTLMVNLSPTITINPSIASICIGDSTDLTASGGITYSWSPSTGLDQTTGATVTATPTSTISYVVTGTDANGCTANSSVTVFVNAYPTVTVSPTSANVCSNQPLPLTGSGAPLYTWSPATGLSATTGATVNALPTTVTTYMVIGNNNGCTDTATVTLTPIPAPTATVSPTSTLICSGNNVTLNAGGGTSYVWMPATFISATTGATVVVNPTASTVYSVVATAPNGCSDTATALVAVNQPPATAVTPASATICSGDSVMLIATGAQTYQWSPSTGLSSTNNDTVWASPNSTITYTCTGITPGCGNSPTQVTVTVNPAPTVTVTPSPVSICQGSFTNLSASGAATYTWSPATGLSSTTGALVTAFPSTATTYFCTGVTAAGCSATVAVNVNVNPIFALNTTSTPVVCGNGNNGTATVTPNGGTPPFTYLWNDTFAQTTATAIGLSPGTYSVVVTDANGCSQTTSVTISSINPMSLNLVYTDALCNGSANGTATVTVTGGTLPYTYSWSDPGGQTTAMADSLAAGTYSVVVTDNNNCTQMISVTIAQPTAVSLSVDSNNAQCHNASGSASSTVSGGTAPYTYSWSNGATTASITGLTEGLYVIVVTDNNGCMRTDSVSIADDQTEACLFIPNAFSPNGDGDHDAWFISNLDLYNSIKLEIYNRWGNKVFENGDYQNSWDGNSNNGKPLPGGVYYYVIDMNNGTKVVQGSLTLIR
jgi:gliding motility-associated-like protein